MTIGEIIAVGTFVITVGGVVWKLALLSADVSQNKSSLKTAHDRIDKYTAKHGGDMDEFREELNSFGRTQARMEEKLNIILDMFKRGGG